jgi:hypothetical protein
LSFIDKCDVGDKVPIANTDMLVIDRRDMKRKEFGMSATRVRKEVL